MAHSERYQYLVCRTGQGIAAGTLASAIVLSLILTATSLAGAQTFTVLHTFTGGADGATPYSGLTIDRAGGLYGTTKSDAHGEGTVFSLTPRGSSWIFAPLYHFAGNGNGAWPEARVVFGPDGSLYGTTQMAGGSYINVVYNLRPPATACASVFCAWTETVLYRFNGFDGYNLDYGDLLFDQQGDFYGTAEEQGDGCYGGQSSSTGEISGRVNKRATPAECSDRNGPPCGGPAGNVYKMTRGNGGWTRTAVYSFMGFPDGGQPASGVIADAAGNLYGTASSGGELTTGAGTVFQLTPGVSCYQNLTLYSFSNGADGRYPVAGLVSDASGNLYGATSAGGANGGGTVFQLTPSGGGWTFHLLYSLTGSGDLPGPFRSLALDSGRQSLRHDVRGRRLCDGFGLQADAWKWDLDLYVIARVQQRQ